MLSNRPIQAALWLVAATAPAFSQCRLAESKNRRVLTYSFVPEVGQAETVLHATLRFRGSTGLQDEIVVPDEWAGETLHGIVNLHAASEHSEVLDTGSPGRKVLRHLPNQEVVLTWDVVKDWTGRFVHPAEFHATLQPEYLEVNGDNALVRPNLSLQDEVTAYFDWKRLPPGWVLATSFGSGPAACQSYSGPWSGVQYALFAAGKFRIHNFQIGPRPAVLAVRGEWRFSDEEAIQDIQRAVGIVRDFWQDDNFPYFLVTLKPFDYDSGQGDGSAFTNAFWLYLSRRDPLSDQMPTLVHETFHEWDPRRMGNPSSPKEWAAIEWFREGFVSYYGYLLALRAGLLQMPTYLDSLNRDLRIFPASTSSYVRGRVIALWLDQRIRKDSRNDASLDSFMHDMVSQRSRPLTESRILETADRYLSPASRAELAKVVEPESSIPTLETDLAPCVRGSIDEISTFNLGFDLDASRAMGVVTGVTQGGPAFLAGLRNGQPLRGRLSIYNNQPDKIAIVTVQTAEGAEHEVQYYPRGEPIKVLQYHSDQQPDEADSVGCQNK